MPEIRGARLRIIGVPCASCIVPVRKALQNANGVNFVGANYVLDLILVDYDPSILGERDVIEIIRKTGYEAAPMNY